MKKIYISISYTWIIEIRTKIILLKRSLSARKQSRKEEKIVNMNLKSEVLELLILVQNKMTVISIKTDRQYQSLKIYMIIVILTIFNIKNWYN